MGSLEQSCALHAWPPLFQWVGAPTAPRAGAKRRAHKSLDSSSYGKVGTERVLIASFKPC